MRDADFRRGMGQKFEKIDNFELKNGWRIVKIERTIK